MVAVSGDAVSQGAYHDYHKGASYVVSAKKSAVSEQVKRWVCPKTGVVFISVSALLELIGDRDSKQAGTTGKVRKVFDDVSRLPLCQQDHIVRVVSALVMQYEQSRQ